MFFQIGNGVFMANSVYSSRKTLRSDLDIVPFYLNNTEFNYHESAKERFLAAKIVNLACFYLYAVWSY